ncbi:hypothetical protein [Sandaracinus amylolyticus]
MGGPSRGAALALLAALALMLAIRARRPR